MKIKIKPILKLILLITLICSIFKGFSQTDTNNIENSSNQKICFDLIAAKKIAKDLIIGDGLKKENTLFQQRIFLLENQLNNKDTLINLYSQKSTIFENQNINLKNQLTISSMQCSSLKTELEFLYKSEKRRKLKNTFIQISLIALLTTSIILKN